MTAFGIYVHVPYCKSLCPYCEFNSYVEPQPPWDNLAKAILADLETHQNSFAPYTLRTIYFGGGTPSLAPAWFLKKVLDGATALFSKRSLDEISLEVNPGSFKLEHTQQWRDLGINRFSLGWQSTHDNLLRILGRGHSAYDSQTAFAELRQAGFDNVNIDLIFAVPQQTMEHLRLDLTQVVALQPEHVSLYCLTYHEGTPFFDWRAQKRLTPISEDRELEMMQLIETELTRCGYEHYEISNYARPKKRAQHNSLYWHGNPYLGVGPGAHSFCAKDFQSGERWEAIRDPVRYIEAWTHFETKKSNPNVPVEWREQLNQRQLLSERFLCALRLTDGIDVRELELGNAAPELQKARIEAENRGWLTCHGPIWRPTALGLLHADSLAQLFF